MIRYHDVFKPHTPDNDVQTKLIGIYTGPTLVSRMANQVRLLLPGVPVLEGTQHIYFRLNLTAEHKKRLSAHIERETRGMGAYWLHRALLKHLRGY